MSLRLLSPAAAVLASTAFWATPAGAYVDDPSRASAGASQVVIAEATRDGTTIVRSGLQVAPADAVRSANLATATAACSGCHATAVAVQVLFVSGDPGDSVRTNAATSGNYACSACYTFAYAWQYIIQTQGPVSLSWAGRVRLAELRREIAATAASVTVGDPASAEELAARLDEIAAQVRSAVDADLSAAGAPVTRVRLLRFEALARPYDRAVSPVRLGRISYVNMAPVFFWLESDVEEVSGVPTELNRLLLGGELDLAPISSIEYARHAHRLRILPRLCVGSEGAVDSIQLVSRVPLERVRRVAVTAESATSVVLTKVLLPEAEHVPLGEDADAKLLIGDAALQSAFEDPTPHYDLGKLWLERTGLPMVFAVWACPDPPAPGLAELEDALVASVGRARAEPERLAYEASERYGYPAGFLARYFEKLRYRFGPRERAGLLTFLELARDVGELERVPELRFVHGEPVPA